ncbi:MAG: hypothetical protein ACKVQQ_10610 [Burkholderiales bacterium]
MRKFEFDDIRQVFEDVESAYPVDRWRVDDLAVWPIIRNDLYLRMFAGYFPPADGATSRSESGWKRRLKGAARIARSMAGDRIPMRAGQRSIADVVLLSDGISYLTDSFGLTEKFCDPIAGIYSQAGYSTLLLNPSPRSELSATTSTFPVRKLLDAQRDRQRALGVLLRRRPRLDLTGYDRCAADVRAATGVSLLGPAELQIIVGTIGAYAAVLETLLAARRAKVGFLCCYYCNEGYAFVLACRRLGIPAVDIQHGVGDHIHLAYVGWHRVPTEGYAVIPSAFWCWTCNDVKQIDRWARPLRSRHRALLGTNLPLDRHLALSGEPDAAQREIEAGLFGASVPSPRRPIRALVSLQPNYLTDAPWRESLHRMMARLGDQVVWWMRLHPGMRGDLERASAMAPAGLQTEYVKCTALPLYTLLRHADVHLTHCSSTALEAAAFGVDTLLLSRLGADYFSGLIAEGRATLVEEPAGFAAALRAAAAARIDPAVMAAGAAARLAHARTTLLSLLADPAGTH